MRKGVLLCAKDAKYHVKNKIVSAIVFSNIGAITQKNGMTRHAIIVMKAASQIAAFVLKISPQLFADIAS